MVAFVGGVVATSGDFVDAVGSGFALELLRKLLPPGRGGVDVDAESALVFVSVPELTAMRLALPSTTAPSSEAQSGGW